MARRKKAEKKNSGANLGCGAKSFLAAGKLRGGLNASARYQPKGAEYV